MSFHVQQSGCLSNLSDATASSIRNAFIFTTNENQEARAFLAEEQIVVGHGSHTVSRPKREFKLANDEFGCNCNDGPGLGANRERSAREFQEPWFH